MLYHDFMNAFRKNSICTFIKKYCDYVDTFNNL